MTSDTGATTMAPHRPLEWSARAIMLFGGLMTALALSGITSVLPQIEADLAHGARDRLLIKQLVGIVGLSVVIGAPLAGFLFDRIGARVLVVLSCVLYAVIGTAGLYLDNLPALIASRLLLGIAAAAIATTSMILINTRLAGIDRAKWMGAHVGVAMISSIIIHPIAGYLGELGWRWPFALYALGLPLALAALGLDRQSTRRLRVAAARPDTGPGLLTWFPVRYAVLAIVIGSITYMPMVYAPFVMRQMGVVSPQLTSFVLTGDAVIGSVLALLYGRSQRYLSVYAAFAFSFACTCAGMLIAALASTVVGVVVGMMVFGLGLGWFVPNLMTAVAQRVTLEQQGRAAGLVKAAHYLAAPLCIIVVEPLARRVGPQGAMMTAAALALGLLILIVYRMLSGRQRAAAPVTPAP